MGRWHDVARRKGPGRGRFIVLEGIDGSGKTSLLAVLGRELRRDHPTLLITREETTSWTGDAVRRAIQEKADPLVTTFLFLADRAGHVAEIRAALEAGRHVLCDRFSASTFAYQGVTLADRVVDPESWLGILHEPFGLQPDHTLLLKVDPMRAVSRLAKRSSKTPYERAEFLRKVQAAYLRRAKGDKTTKVVDADRPADLVARDAVKRVRGWLA